MENGSVRHASHHTLLAGLIAGLIAGVALDAFLLTLGTRLGHQPPLDAFRFIASTLLGKDAFHSPLSDVAAPALGIAMHLMISAGWGIGYAYLLPQTPQLLRHPLISGTVYGIVVYVVMQLLLLANGMAQPVTQQSLVVGLISHTFFYAIPIALIIPGLATRR
jgi:hypothetical protein